MGGNKGKQTLADFVYNPIESIYTGTMYCFDTMSKVCIVLFQIMQKFDDVVIFLTLSQRKHGFLHLQGQKNNIMSKTVV